MTYSEWEQEHTIKVAEIMGRIKASTLDEIAEYFKYDNMVKKEKEFCPLYKDNIKCHNIDDLNCYYCGCPHFNINDNPATTGKTTIVSSCSIDSKYKDIFYENPDENNVVRIHCDCTNCFIPHKTSYVKKTLNKELTEFNTISKCNPLIEYVRLKQLRLIPSVIK